MHSTYVVSLKLKNIEVDSTQSKIGEKILLNWVSQWW
jgi:hypothetical protein